MKFEKHLLRGWCNSTCLAAESNTHAKCFTDAIQSHGPGLDLWSISYGIHNMDNDSSSMTDGNFRPRLRSEIR